MYCSPLSKNDCSLFKVYNRRMINKERWMQKLSGILLNYYYFFFSLDFFLVMFWAVGIFWVRVSPEGLFLGMTISSHSHIPITK